MDLAHVDVEINEEEPRAGVLKLLQNLRPDWSQEQVQMKSFTEGITNHLIGCFVGPEPDSDCVLIRVFGRNTDLFVDRVREVQMIQVLESEGCGPRIYCSFKNGISYEFITGTSLSDGQLREPAVYRLIASELAKIHSIRLKSSESKEPFLWRKMEQFLNLIQTSKSSQSEERQSNRLVPGPEVLTREMSELKSHLSQLHSPVVLCHNDLLTKNIIYNRSQGSVRFIDYEYADFNYQAFDIGNHFNEFAGVNDVNYSHYPGPELQRDWLRVYLQNYKQHTGSDVTEQEVTRLYVQVCKFSLASNLFWGMWAMLQSRFSSIDFDFNRYAAARLKYYFEKRDQYLSLHLEQDLV